MEERCSTGTPLESPEPVGAHRGEQPSRGGVSTASSELQPEPSPCGHTSRCALQRTSVFTSCCVADACALSAPETRFSNPRSPSMETPHPEPQRTLRRAKAHLECPSSLRCRSQGPSQGSPNGSWQTNAPPRSPDLDRTPSRRAMPARQRFRRRFLRNHPKARGHVPTRTDCDCLAAHRE